MNPYNRAVRTAIAGMERERAVRWLGTHPLGREERDCIAAMDVYGHSAARTADRLFISTETVKRRKRTGYGRIAAALSG